MTGSFYEAPLRRFTRACKRRRDGGRWNRHRSNERRTMTTKKQWLATLAVSAVSLGAMLAAPAAHAGGNVSWSIDIRAPLDPYGATIGTTIGNAPRHVYHPAPVVYAPPVVVAPAPVYYAPPPVYYAPRPRVIYAPVAYRPARVLPAPVYVPYRHGHQHHRHDRRDRRDHDD
jgi:hypothetical protein